LVRLTTETLPTTLGAKLDGGLSKRESAVNGYIGSQHEDRGVELAM